MNVFVTGGTGYVGRAITDELLRRGHTVTMLVRTNSPRSETPADARVVRGTVFDEDILLASMPGHDAVVHLVGIIREIARQGVTMEHIHVDGTLAVVHAAAQSGITDFLHMSALGARADAVSRYHQSKWKAEQAVRKAGLAYTIFQPSVIFGSGGPGPNFVRQLADLVRSAPLTPVIGRGTVLLQPVSTQTVAEAFCNALTRPETRGQTYQLGGPATLSYEEILRQIATTYHRPFRPIHIPMALMRMVTALMQQFPSFPITAEQLQMLSEGNVCSDPHTAYDQLGLQPVPFRVDAGAEVN